MPGILFCPTKTMIAKFGLKVKSISEDSLLTSDTLPTKPLGLIAKKPFLTPCNEPLLITPEEVKVKGKLQLVKTYKVNDVLSEHRNNNIFYEDEGFLLNIEDSKITNVDFIIDNLRKSILKLQSNKREK